MLVATRETWIRTASGVAKIAAGEGVPDDALSTAVDRLVAARVLAEPEPVDPPADPKPATIKTILAEVGDDLEKAQAALDAEKSGENRSTLIKELEAIIAAAQPQPAEAPEA